MTALIRLMTEHPKSVDESYLQHMAFALKFSGALFAIAVAALVHAFLPFLFEKTASRKITELYGRIHNRGS